MDAAHVTARARLVKPGFFSNEELAALPMAGRLLFIGLWTIADRLGRLEDRPRRIKADLFPYEANLDIDVLIDGLEQSGFIVRYEAAGTAYIQVVSFLKHQSPHVREAASVIPEIGEGAPKASLGDAKATPRFTVAVAVPVPIAVSDPVAVAVSDPEDADASDLLPPVLRAWESATGTLITQMTADLMDHWIGEVGQEWVLDAIKETNLAGSKAWKYTTAILERWKREGREVQSDPAPAKFRALESVFPGMRR